jgi:hypothetical protein
MDILHPEIQIRQELSDTNFQPSGQSFSPLSGRAWTIKPGRLLNLFNRGQKRIQEL